LLFGFVIAVPLVLFGLAGKWLDARQHTNKLFTLIGILAALVVSTAFLIRRLRSIMLSIKSASALKVPKE
jgi:ABC-type sulfate transport system permease component